jgi:hypothetical protein
MVTTNSLPTATQNVTFVFTGNEIPCLGDFPVPDPCAVGVPPVSTEFNGVYTET